jgi:hypothetical protein
MVTRRRFIGGLTVAGSRGRGGRPNPSGKGRVDILAHGTRLEPPQGLGDG